MLRIGTSGWVYPHWKGVFYPPGLRADRQLAFYATRFETVEVNASFYRLPEGSVFASWRKQTPPGFLFAVKASRYLTHMKKLKDPAAPLARFLANARRLREKLGPVLFQFPRAWPINLERLAAFLQELRRQHRRGCFAFELRHPSWLVPAVYDLLAAEDAALCLPVGAGAALDPRLVASWTYIRMHHGQEGTRYTRRELAVWAERIECFLSRGADTYVYFNNDPEGHAVRDAGRLARLLGVEAGRDLARRSPLL